MSLGTDPRSFDDGHPRLFNDVALLRLPGGARSSVHPATFFWGGPTGLASPPSPGTDLVAFGNTPLRDGGREAVNALDPIQGAATRSVPRSTQAHLAPQPVPGDSGSPAQTASGRALGTLSAIGAPGVTGSVTEPRPAPQEGTTIISNLAHPLEVMENETALEVELKTWLTFSTPRAQDLARPSTAPVSGT